MIESMMTNAVLLVLAVLVLVLVAILGVLYQISSILQTYSLLR